MTTKFINCPTCGKNLEYWAEGDFIECTGCRAQVQVEPCEREAEQSEVVPENVELIEVEV